MSFDLLRRAGSVLNTHYQIISSEVVFGYPNIGEEYPDQRRLLLPLSNQSLWQIFGESNLLSIEGSLLCSHLKLWGGLEDQLSSVYPQPDWLASDNLHRPKYSLDALVGVGDKKLHELTKVAPLVEALAHHQGRSKPLKVLDIGGGVGHLARLLTFYHGVTVTSFDRDQRLQQKGASQIKRHLANQEGSCCPLEWEHGQWGDGGDQKQLLSNKTLLVGLHACGNLSAQLIEAGVRNAVPAIISLGCCYARFTGTGRHYLSQAGQSLSSTQRIEWNQFSLTLSSRAHRPPSFAAFERDLLVKSYRYKLHLLLFHLLDTKKFVAVGEVRPHHYQGEFFNYTLGRLAHLKIKHQLGKDQIDDFVQQQWVEDRVRELIICDLIRWQLGRVAEIFLLLDRALFLEEQGYRVTVLPLFDPRISPRNLGIVAYRGDRSD